MGRPAKTDPDRFCEECGKQLTRKRYGEKSRMEDRNVFLERRFCNRICMILSMISEEELQKNGYLQRARKYRGDTCDLCGSKEKLDAHHKDRNRANNDPKNIQTLCHSCHMKMHWANGDIK